MDETLSLGDLKDALKETLEARGSLGPIKARLRAEIFQALDEGGVKPKLSNENLIINELIREYLEYNGYRHTLSVFLPESGQPLERPFQRRFLAHELHIAEDPRYNQIPLVYGIVAALQDARTTAESPPRADARPATPPTFAVPTPSMMSEVVPDASGNHLEMPASVALETRPPVAQALPAAVLFMN